MTPDDFETLANFLHGIHWRAALAADSGVRPENLKRLASGRRNVPPALAEFLLRRCADRWLLRGWQDQALPAGLSAATSSELEQRIARARVEAARLTGDPDHADENPGP